MPRAPRIEYENAIYHVMNRGRGKQIIFHNFDYYFKFLDTLDEAASRFGCVIHAYCLMGNHYHLLIETPLANLSRVMRHINGVYTQRYNRLMQTDGPLFRGRYKAILVGHDQYFLNVSRYIHRNPIETTPPLVTRLEDYCWSSYPAFLNLTSKPKWLSKELTEQLFHQQDMVFDLRQFILHGNDKETVEFHKSKRTGSIFGSKTFKSWIYEELLTNLAAETKSRVIQPNQSIETVVNAVAKHYETSIGKIITCRRGRIAHSEARKTAMYLSQELTSATLAQISETFNLQHYRSASFITHQCRVKKRDEPEYQLLLEAIIQKLIT